MHSRIHCLIALIALTGATLAAQPTVTSVNPARNANSAASTTNITAGFSSAMAAPGSSDFRVRSNLRGWLGGNLSGGGTSNLAFNPTSDLLPGEEIEISLTTGLQASAGGALSDGNVWRFRAEASQGPTMFTHTVQNTSVFAGWDCEFGDLDNDGDLDMVVIDNGQSFILTNDGAGVFSAAALSSTMYGSYHCALADIESDGDVDIIMVCSPMSTSSGAWSGQNLIYINDGSAGFGTTVNFGSGNEYSIDVDAGDLDGDGDIDFVVANGAVSDIANDIYLNDGSGNFTRRGFLYVSGSTTEVADNSWAVRLADVDNDGDLDVFTGNFGFGPVQSYFYLNDGDANFYYTSRVNLGAAAIAVSMATGDFDGNGYVDVVVGHLGQPSGSPSTYNRVSVYFNNGSGSYGSPYVFAVSDVPYGLETADVDGDGDLDLAIGFESGTSYIRTNPGNGQFTGAINLVGTAHSFAFADVDGDGDLDVGMPDRICINGSNAPTISVSVSSGSVANGGTVNVSYGDTLASLSMQITVDDPNNDNVSMSASITNNATQGMQATQFSSGSAAPSYTLYPTAGVFNQGGTTHVFTLDATDGVENTVFTFSIAVGSAPNNAPGIAVSTISGSVTSGASINVAWNTALSSLGLNISVTDPENDNVSLAGAVTNTSGTGILASEFSSSAQATGYNLYPTTGVFNAANTTHVVTLSADDGNGGTANFTFNVSVGPAPTPTIELYETTAGGTAIGNGANASGGRDFGSQLVSAGATGSLTVVIHNSGSANLAVSSVSLSGSDATHFVLNASSTSSSVAPGASSQFTLAFDPTSAGSKTATVEISHNDTSIATPYTFEITGVGTTPAPVALIVVKEGGVTVANGAGASGNRNFGSLLIGSPSAPLTITIENAGNANLTLGTPGLSGSGALEYSVDTTGMLATVPAGQSTTFTVTFLAATQGTFNATVSFTHNDVSTTTPFSFDVTGSAAQPVVTQPSSGGSGDSGGGCVAQGGSSMIALALLLLLGGLAVARRRVRA